MTNIMLKMHVPALFLRYGVKRPGTSGVTTPRQEPEPFCRAWGEAAG